MSITYQKSLTDQLTKEKKERSNRIFDPGKDFHDKKRQFSRL